MTPSSTARAMTLDAHDDLHSKIAIGFYRLHNDWRSAAGS
jgi:hypothetical protein